MPLQRTDEFGKIQQSAGRSERHLTNRRPRVFQESWKSSAVYGLGPRRRPVRHDLCNSSLSAIEAIRLGFLRRRPCGNHTPDGSTDWFFCTVF
ncbi:MAG: hypothetical protein C0483_01370 [Pirellula sp.]|nr:hypothetical protein [Pirellula sp.]